MITRLVKLELTADKADQFKLIFDRYKDKIRSQQGCHHVELLHDIKQPETFFTYSVWESEADLNAYRKSELFGEVWPLTKTFFSEKAEAWSLEKISEAKE
jgi:hypothetical protein